MSNKFIPKVYQPVDDEGNTWEWVEMTPPATGSVLGMVFISDLGVNNNENFSEPNIFDTTEGANVNTTVSPVGVKNAIQSMALSKTSVDGDYILGDSGIDFGNGNILSSWDQLGGNLRGSDTISIDIENDGEITTKVFSVKPDSITADHILDDTGVIMVNVGNPNERDDIEPSYKYYIQV